MSVPLVDEETVAVNVTDCPTVDGFCVDVRAVVVAAPVLASGVPLSGTEIGLPVALVVMNT